jgi:hypothetical protein
MTQGEFENAHSDDAALGRLLRERLPRHHAPARLRAAILRSDGAPAPAGSWLPPALSAVATALLAVMVLLSVLPRTQADPLQGMVRAVLSEHTRHLMWGEARPAVVAEVLPRLMEETGIGVSWFFVGDGEVQLLGVDPIYLDGKKGLAFYYQDPEGHMVSYLVLAAQGIPMPDRGRIQIDRFRPLLTKANGFSLFVWKQQGLTCFLISDMVSEYDLSRFREYFLRVRFTTEPFPIQ